MKKCQAILKSGKNKGLKCGKATEGKFCKRHEDACGLPSYLTDEKIPLKDVFNKYFNKIFVVNLKDKKVNYDKIAKRLDEYGIKHSRFIAVDGRGSPEEQEKKRESFSKKYKLKLSKKLNMPATSLSIGTVLMLRRMVKNKWKRMLIFEDDIVVDPEILTRFYRGIRDIYCDEWDLLYLGCGNECGLDGVGWRRTKKHKNISTWNTDPPMYVNHPWDLRKPCGKACVKISKDITEADSAGGTWGYAWSLEGAKKFLKQIKGKINDHIDQLLMASDLKVYAFDPPIVWHENGMLTAGQNTIPW